jgi:DNA-binding NtrC family response regulator
MSNEKILIIDDEEDMLESCSRLLKKKNYTCITTDKSSEALEIVSAEKPALAYSSMNPKDRICTLFSNHHHRRVGIA